MSGKRFAFAYYREELKAKDCNPDIFAQQNENKDNPHKTKHVEACMKALGKVGNSHACTIITTRITITNSTECFHTSVNMFCFVWVVFVF